MASGTETTTGAGYPATEHAEGMPQLDFSTFGNQIFWLVITLVVIYFILNKIALPRIAAVLAERADEFVAVGVGGVMALQPARCAQQHHLGRYGAEELRQRFCPRPVVRQVKHVGADVRLGGQQACLPFP